MQSLLKDFLALIAATLVSLSYTGFLNNGNIRRFEIWVMPIGFVQSLEGC